MESCNILVLVSTQGSQSWSFLSSVPGLGQIAQREWENPLKDTGTEVLHLWKVQALLTQMALNTGHSQLNAV